MTMHEEARARANEHAPPCPKCGEQTTVRSLNPERPVETAQYHCKNHEPWTPVNRCPRCDIVRFNSRGTCARCVKEKRARDYHENVHPYIPKREHW